MLRIDDQNTSLPNNMQKQRRELMHSLFGYDCLHDLLFIWFAWELDVIWRLLMRRGNRKTIVELLGTWLQTRCFPLTSKDDGRFKVSRQQCRFGGFSHCKSSTSCRTLTNSLSLCGGVALVRQRLSCVPAIWITTSPPSR
jgi:hypothetical protein